MGTPVPKHVTNAAVSGKWIAFLRDNLVKAGDGMWATDDHDGGRGRPARVFQLATGHGNTNTKNAEENQFALPLADRE